MECFALEAGPRLEREASADQLLDTARASPTRLALALEDPRGVLDRERRIVSQAKRLEIAPAERKRERDTLTSGHGLQRFAVVVAK